MIGSDFYNTVAKHDGLEWLGCKEGKTPSEDHALIRVIASDAKFSVSVSAIRDNKWEDLEAVLLGKRSPRIMTHITRIVGYYSQLQNWNRSKIAELGDRHKGDYSVPRSTPPIDSASSAGPEAVALAS